MSEPFLERLSGFTPQAGNLDRDALLFAAGRASARPNRGWITLAGTLAATQALALVLLWPHASPPAAGPGVQVADSSARLDGVEPNGADRWADPGVWSLAQGLQGQEPEDQPPAGAGTLLDDGPPWRAFAPPPASILN
jgi:hypothetical protein